MKNYRPIAIMNACAKIFEKVLKPYLTSYIYPLISEAQHGFMPKRSTTTNLITLTNDLSNSFNAYSQTDVLYFDFSKAFDKVNHNVLIKKLFKTDLPKYLIFWIMDYLCNRVYRITINGYNSDLFITNMGVPQGSILGPILFLIFINDLPSELSYSKCLLFADDVKIYKNINSTSDCEKLNTDATKIYKWCLDNKMELNASKCIMISYHNISSPFIYFYSINHVPLIRAHSVKDLGIIFDDKLSFDLHLKHITSKAYQALGFLMHRSKEFRNTNTFIYLYTALVRPILDYGSTIWNPYTDKDILTLEKIQRKFIRFIRFKSNMSYISYEPLCHNLSIPLLINRRSLTDSLFIFKLLNYKIDSSHLLSLIYFIYHHYNCRTSNLFFTTNKINNNIKFNSPIDRSCRNLNVYINTDTTIDIFTDSKKDFCFKILATLK